MIVEIDIKNIGKLENTFVPINYLKKELKNNPFAKILVLKEKEEIIGYIYYSDIYERAEINQFEIDYIHRNCGKGNYLLRRMIEIVDKDITLEVRVDNKSAIALYQKNGFLNKAIRKNYYKDKDGILMERKRI